MIVRHTFFRGALALFLDIVPLDPSQKFVALEELDGGVIIVAVIGLARILRERMVSNIYADRTQ